MSFTAVMDCDASPRRGYNNAIYLKLTNHFEHKLHYNLKLRQESVENSIKNGFLLKLGVILNQCVTIKLYKHKILLSLNYVKVFKFR